MESWDNFAEIISNHAEPNILSILLHNPTHCYVNQIKSTLPLPHSGLNHGLKKKIDLLIGCRWVNYRPIKNRTNCVESFFRNKVKSVRKMLTFSHFFTLQNFHKFLNNSKTGAKSDRFVILKTKRLKSDVQKKGIQFLVSRMMETKNLKKILIFLGHYL